MASPGMAPAYSLHRHPASFKNTVFLQSFFSVLGAGGRKPAFGTEQWRNANLIYFY